MQNQALILFYAALVLSVVSALLKGGVPERIGATIMVVMTVLDVVGAAFVPGSIFTVDPVAIIADAFGTVSFGTLALYSRRAWPIWATSLQILSLSSHFAEGVDPAAHPGVYILMKSGPTFFVLIALMVGTAFHQRRMRRRGSDPAWMDW